MSQRNSRILGAVALLFIAAACGSGNVLGPNNNLEVTNNTDSFQAQASNMDAITQTLTYAWQNTGTTANVNRSGSITGGTATLRITDDAGTEVYNRSLTQTGSQTTSTGVAGDWTIEVTLDGASGTLNFRVEKP